MNVHVHFKRIKNHWIELKKYNCLMELYNFLNNTNFHFSWKCIFPLLLYLGMLGLRWMSMHLWLNLIKRTIDIQEKLKIVKNKQTMYKVNG